MTSRDSEWYQIGHSSSYMTNWYQTKPSDVFYFPKQFLGWDFFAFSCSKPALVSLWWLSSVKFKYRPGYRSCDPLKIWFLESLESLLLPKLILYYILKSFQTQARNKRKGDFEHLKFIDCDLKGQTISEWIVEVIISPKIWTKTCQDFCPYYTGQKSWQFLVGILEETMTF